MRFQNCGLAVLLTLTIVTAVQAAEDWKTYRYPQNGFSIEFPAAPISDEVAADPKRNIREMRYASDLGDVAYIADATLFLHSVIHGLPLDKQIQKVLEAVRGSLKCTIASQREIKFPGATAIEAVFEKCAAPVTGGAKWRGLISGDWLYQMLVLGSTPGIAGSPGAERFLASFSLIAQ
jgi:hypothetical protein